jgi:hypothetical protein
LHYSALVSADCLGTDHAWRTIFGWAYFGFPRTVGLYFDELNDYIVRIICDH